MPHKTVELLGREDETERIAAVLAAAADGTGGTLVIRGDAGIGKTALLGWAAADASQRGFEVVELLGIQFEQLLAYGALHRLIGSDASLMSMLPDLQREAMEIAFGLREGNPPAPLLFGLSLLSWLSARTGPPLLIAVDDAQWIDAESLRALAFVARRLGRDSTALLIAVRDPAGRAATAALHDLPELSLPALRRPAAEALMRSVVGGFLARSAVERVMNATAGNPLGIRELTAGMQGEVRDGRAVPNDPLRLAPRLERRYAQLARAAGPRARLLLLVAATEPTAGFATIVQVCAELGLPQDELEALDVSMLASIDDDVVFRHPLVRSAVYGDATAAERTRVHRAFANRLDRSDQPDLWARHFAAATLGPSEEVAAALEASAARNRRRGGWLAAGDLYLEGARRAAEEASVTRLLIETLRCALAAGPLPRAVAIAAELDARALSDRERAFLVRSRATLAKLLHDVHDAPAALIDAARTLTNSSPPDARDALLEAFEIALLWQDDGTPGLLGSIAGAAAELPPEDDAGSLLLRGYSARVSGDYTTARMLWLKALHTAELESPGTHRLTENAWLWDKAVRELWDDPAYRSFMARVVAQCRSTGDLAALRTYLTTVARCELLAGHFDAASDAYAEIVTISVSLDGGGTVWRLLDTELRAWRGDEDGTREAAHTLLSGAESGTLPGFMAIRAHIALCTLSLAEGRYADALEHGRFVFERDAGSLASQVLPDIVEAAARASDLVFAAEVLARLEARAEAAGTAWSLGVLARSRALLAPAAEATALFTESLERLASTGLRTELARTQLLFGEALRRRRQRRAAHAQLAAARDLFEEIGARGFAERARRELAPLSSIAEATGPSATALTAQESRVVALAVAGASNAEIAEQLFISVATVEFHLGKVYRKFGVTSRTQLATAILS